nr:hypothetical protein [Kofleriaceae bacterium]
MIRMWKYLRVVLALVALWFVYEVFTVVHGCSQRPWDKYDMDTQPDIACRAGSVAGWDLYVWSCVDGERVVIGKMSAEMMASAPQKSTAACGVETELEHRVLDTLARTCRPGYMPMWGGGDGRAPTIERTYVLATPEPAPKPGEWRTGVGKAAAPALERLAKIDHFADLETYDERAVLVLPASATPAQLEADARAVEADGLLRPTSGAAGSGSGG